MGGVAVLHPQDSFPNHRDILYSKPMKSPPPVKFNHTPTNRPSSTANSTVPDGRRRTQPKRIVRKNVVVVEQPATTSSKNLVLGSKNKTTEFFAGFAFVDSPPPSSVPLPGFFKKNCVAAMNDPTADLRRILGLSLS